MTAVVIGGTAGLGLEVARRLSSLGEEVVVGGRDRERGARAVAELGTRTSYVGVDLADPASIAPALESVERVDRLVISAIERDLNSIQTYDVRRAVHLVTLKLVGYAEAVHALSSRFAADASIVLFGGVAFERPYPGSTTVTTVNGGVSGLTRTLAVELAPIRVNAVHPGVIGDSPAVLSGWTDAARNAVSARTPIGRLVVMDEIVDAVVFLLRNTGVNGVNLTVDGGWLNR
ncbi:MAG TPA: SDR family oxidoreductase [Solirubrobacteraceae bacterium]|nr:SDR family oxidoreductase [Solirubrobacteraceae bacterium]